MIWMISVLSIASRSVISYLLHHWLIILCAWSDLVAVQPQLQTIGGYIWVPQAPPLAICYVGYAEHVPGGMPEYLDTFEGSLFHTI